MVTWLVLACSETPQTREPPSAPPPIVVQSAPVVAPAKPAPAELIPATPAPPPAPKLPLPRASALPVPTPGGYPELVRGIEAARKRFASAKADSEARDYLYDAVTTRIIPAWRGTPWTFYGHAEVPGDEPIACGYWVASVLRDVGFRVNRDEVGQQASERILRTFAPAAALFHFGSKPYTDVVAWIERHGKGLWGVGLANHAGMLWNDGSEVRFCHSNYNEQRGPICENALYSGPFRTSFTVVASVLAPDTITAWLAGTPLPTGAFAD